MRRAIVLGASSGMGLEVSKMLASAGWRVGVAARRVELLESVRALRLMTRQSGCCGSSRLWEE